MKQKRNSNWLPKGLFDFTQTQKKNEDRFIWNVNLLRNVCYKFIKAQEHELIRASEIFSDWNVIRQDLRHSYAVSSASAVIFHNFSTLVCLYPARMIAHNEDYLIRPGSRSRALHINNNPLGSFAVRKSHGDNLSRTLLNCVFKQISSADLEALRI